MLSHSIDCWGWWASCNYILINIFNNFLLIRNCFVYLSITLVNKSILIVPHRRIWYSKKIHFFMLSILLFRIYWRLVHIKEAPRYHKGNNPSTATSLGVDALAWSVVTINVKFSPEPNLYPYMVKKIQRDSQWHCCGTIPVCVSY